MNVRRLYELPYFERQETLAKMSLAEATAYKAGVEKLVAELHDKPSMTWAEREMLDFYCEDGKWEAKRAVREAQARERQAAQE